MTTAESIAEAFEKLVAKALNEDGILPEDIMRLKSIASMKSSKIMIDRIYCIILVVVLIFGLAPAIFFGLIQSDSEIGYTFADRYFSYYGGSVLEDSCSLYVDPFIKKLFRGPIDCSLCTNVTEVQKVKKLSHQEFLERYAFTMQPVIVTDVQSNWTAKNTFNFEFFRNLYSEGSDALDRVDNRCQFFRYATELTSLSEALNMSKDRIEGKGKPWYIGWSNCDGKTANILRKHYSFPYFLPPQLDHSKTDWVFMGLPGYGAPMHIDKVGAASWQAQIQGTKKWVLEAPPECVGICATRIEIAVEPGETIVIDGNKWYHSTEIIGNETSIVIGSEYY